MATAIEINGIGKMYRLGVVSTGTLSHDLKRWWTTGVLGKEDPYLKVGEENDRSVRGGSDYVWALKDIDLRVEQGDVVGLIGKNGAGKSTLLKILSRITAPTTGTIRARGRIGSLLEVGTGFHSEMTGRENIYLNGAILGMTKAEIGRKLDEIVDFSGCERYLDTPVKRYSSGMLVRLGFAVAAHLDPEILVVDEVLAVGDAEFQKKALGKMREVSRGEGRTVLFVSHNMASIQQLCTSCVVLEKGRAAFVGGVGEGVERYLQGMQRRQSYAAAPDGERLQLLEAAVGTPDGGAVYPATPLRLRMVVAVRDHISRLVLGFNTYSSYGYPLTRADYNDLDRRQTLAPGVYELLFDIPPYTFATGDYNIVFDVAEMNIRNYAGEATTLHFSVTAGEEPYGNAFNEQHPLKCSVVRHPWLTDCKKIQ